MSLLCVLQIEIITQIRNYFLFFQKKKIQKNFKKKN